MSQRSEMKVCAIGLRGIPDVMGGIETHCENLYPEMIAADPDCAVTVIGRSPYIGNGEFRNVRVKTVWAPKQKFLETLIHTPLAILFARISGRVDVLHLHGIGPGFFAPLARALGFRLISTHHALDYNRPKWSSLGRAFLRAGEFMIAKFSNRIVCVSDVVRGELVRKYPHTAWKSVTIRNGAPPLPASLPDASSVLEDLGLSERPYVLAVGRLDSTKGFDVLIEAFKASRISATHTLAIAGGGQEGDPYLERLRRLGGDEVKFLGAQPAAVVRRLYENTALFVHASHLEGFPLVVMEALGAGAPLVISNIGPHLEVRLPTAHYFEDGNTAQLTAILDAGDFASLRPAGADEILTETAWPNLARQHLKLFRQVWDANENASDQPAASELR